VPRAVVADVFSDGRISYDLMIRGDWFWPTWPPAPQWQLMGLGYSIAASDAPATVGYAPCVGIEGERCRRPPELFGQINDPTIVAMEVLVGGSWRRFAVTRPGFAVRLDGTSGEPAGYRWLDGAGRTVWELDLASSTKPGSRHRKLRAERRKREAEAGATPAPFASP
jgi:hypothetical protein